MSLTLLSEPGIYRLTARSSKPEAKAFDRWVRHEVLPAIRKDGMYVAGEEKMKTGEMSIEEMLSISKPRREVSKNLGADEKRSMKLQNTPDLIVGKRGER